MMSVTTAKGTPASSIRVQAQFVNPYVKSNKNDANDAEAICEAVSRPHMRFVPAKSAEQRVTRRLGKPVSTSSARHSRV